ncbi:MAG: hypothetical protein HY784_06235 [Chloroflexi bacterium]|nr:hypothetical protein [Chloroflexota bacterium]
MNFLWEAWLGAFTEVTNEAIINRVQGKTAETYRDLMARAFREMYRVLKPGRWLTLAFHNSSSKVWAAIQTALATGGFAVHRTQTLDKRHGTFKQFVSENAVGYDLIIHCQKVGRHTSAFSIPSRQVSSVASVREFVERALEQNPNDFVVRYLHVNRENEFDSRKLYSLWVKQQTEAGGVIDLDYEEFRRMANQFALMNT